MYNRYIPQPDGSYRRSRVEEPSRRPPERPQRPAPSPGPPCPPPPPEPDCPPPPKPRPVPHERPDSSVTGFLKRLLPKNFDTGDLLIVLLLLLMAGDSQEDQNTALLTLALYFFM